MVLANPLSDEAPLLRTSVLSTMLESLKRNIEDAEHNTTRFLVLSREAFDPDPRRGKVITSFVFRVRNVPAALYKAMGGFATNGVNMTKLESYMIGGRFTATLFYADVEGHPKDRNLALALGTGGSVALALQNLSPGDEIRFTVQGGQEQVFTVAGQASAQLRGLLRRFLDSYA